MNTINYTNSEKSQNFSFEFEKRIEKFSVKMKYTFIFLILIVFNSMLYSQSNIFSYEDLISLSKKEASFIKTPTTIYLHQLNSNINVETYKYLKGNTALYVIRFLYY